MATETFPMKKIVVVSLIIIFFLAVFFFAAYSHRTVPKQKPNRKFIHAQGRYLVDGNGNKIRLKGFNMGFVGTMLAYKNLKGKVPLEVIDRINDEKIRNLFTEWDFKNMKSIGANSFRVFLRFYQFETEPYHYDDGLLKTYDYLVNTAYKNGIYTVLTLNWAGQNEVENINNGLGNTLWTDEELQKRVIDAWEYIAEHYKDNPGIAGYDILNEPTAPDNQSLHDFYVEAIKAIRKHDKNHLIILERESMAKTPKQRKIHWAGEYDDDNLMFEDHYYNDAAGHKYADINVPLPKYQSKEKINQYLFWDIQKAKTRPVFIGEFGALWRSGKEGLRWTKDLLELMDKYEFSWSYFPYKKMVHAEGNIRGWYASKKSVQTLKAKYIIDGRLTEDYIELLQTRKNYQENINVKTLLKDFFD